MLSHLIIGDRLIIGCTTNSAVQYNLTNFNFIGYIGIDGGKLSSSLTHTFAHLEDDVFVMGHDNGQITLVDGTEVLQFLQLDRGNNAKVNRIYKTSRPNEIVACTMNGFRFLKYDSDVQLLIEDLEETPFRGTNNRIIDAYELKPDLWIVGVYG